MTTNLPLSKRIIASLVARREADQWEELIANLLRRLEISPAELRDARAEYEDLAAAIAKKLDIPRHDVTIFPQGSMRTQTTIAQRHPVKFDLDIVVKLSGPKYDSADPEVMFKAFGVALEGNEEVTGPPKEKRRCWRLWYPNKPYYFDVTPAVADRTGQPGSSLSVRDPDTRWAPSNPEEFAQWFCEYAALRFPFQVALAKSQVEARTTVAPVPDEKVGLDDILRRAVQLMKLHRDNEFWFAAEKKEAMPISVIIVTTATRAYADLVKNRANEFSSPIEVVLALVEAMPNYIHHDPRTGWRVENPKLATENFADKWNNDHGARQQAFMTWHRKLEADLDSLLHQDHRTPGEDRIRSVFGNAGVEAWKASKPKASVLDGLIGSAAGHTQVNPDRPVRPGSSNTLG
jgi:hypothetical protein